MQLYSLHRTKRWIQKIFGFQSRKFPPQIEEMKCFEEGISKMVGSVSFRKVNTEFLDKLTKDIDKIRTSEDVLVRADKTRNVYAVGRDQYNKLLSDIVTNLHDFAPTDIYRKINTKATNIVMEFGILRGWRGWLRRNCMWSWKSTKITSKPNCPADWLILPNRRLTR